MMMVSDISKRLLRDEAQFHELPCQAAVRERRYISSSVGQLSVRNFFVSCSQLSVRQLVDVRC